VTPRTNRFSLEDIIRLQEQENEAWQEQLKGIARGDVLGFSAEIVPEEVPGYGVLPEREFKIKHLDRVHALFNAIKHVLAKAAQAVADEEGREYSWDEWVTVKRRDAMVRVYRTVENGKPRPMPQVFVDTILSTQSRTARSLPKREGTGARERRLVGRTPNREAEDREESRAG
jgi:hypothetical protein